MARDPVCSMHVEENTPFVSEYKGNKYCLCSEGCKTSFERDPQVIHRSKWMNSYLL